MTLGRSILTVSYSSILDDPRVMAEGRILASLGYRVTVIGVALDAPPSRFSVDGMDITTVPLVSSYRPDFLLASIWAILRGQPISRSGQFRRSTYLSLLFFNLWVLRLGSRTRPRVIHCQEHQALPAAWVLSRLNRGRVVYDAHENTSLNRAGAGLKGALTIRVERFFLRRVDAVITVGERLASSLRTRGARRVVVIGNWKALEDFDVSATDLGRRRAELGLPPDALVVSYIGLLDRTRDIEPLLAAAAGESDVHLLIAGRGELKEPVREAARSYSNIHWLDWLPLKEVPLYTQLSDVIYCCMNQGLAQLEFQMPNKLFDAFAAGKAVIARNVEGEMRQLLARYPAAIQLDHVTAESVISAFRKLRDPVVLHELQQQAAAGGREFNATVAAERLAALFAMMFDPASGRSSSPEPILSSGRDETLESIRAAYRDYREDGRSALWEQSNAGNRRSSAARDAELVRLVLRSASSDAASSILDVGCGNGRFAGLLLEQRVPLKVTGLDLLPDRVRTARERVPEADFVVGSADEIPFPDSSFDAASAITLFSSVPSLTMESAIAREIDRVLRPGGSLVWYDIRYKNPWNRRVHGVTTRHLEALFPGWSMEVHSITLLPPVARRLGRLTSVGYPALHSLPILRSHLIGTLRKPT